MQVLSQYTIIEPTTVREKYHGLSFGSYNKHAALSAYAAIGDAARDAHNNKIDAIITAPVNKESINKAGIHFTGHTELLAEKTGTSSFIMMMYSDKLIVSLVTTHIPIMALSSILSKDTIYNAITLTGRFLEQIKKTSAIKIAVTGLNPHAGEGGYIGKEEIQIIKPAVQSDFPTGWNVSGPFSADTLFNRAVYNHEFDAIVAMYHDQGLTPFKLTSFGKGVNITLGLPIIRVSVDHGTGYDIAGHYRADPSSIITAVQIATQLIER